MNISPNTHFLTSIRADRGSYTALLAEAIDNSFDADAKEIAITLRKDLVGIQDNGQGITKENQDAIVRLGEHRAMPTTQLGRFGIGLKYHAVSAANVLEVDSISSDGHMHLTVDWQRVIRSGQWEIRDPVWQPKLVTTPTGTNIVIRDFHWSVPTQKDVETARDQLAQIFYPALANGRVVTLNNSALPILREPELIHIVEGEVRLPNGKGARVRGGIMVHTGRLYQVQVSYKHRVIMPHSTFGCDSYGGLRKLFARVDLTGDWGLARFKNEISDNDEPELETAVQEILKPVLEECHSQQMSATVDRMTQLLNEMLPEEMAAARPEKKKDKPTRRGKKRKQQRKNEIKEGQETPRGPVNKRAQNQTLIIDFDQPLVDEHGYGLFQPGRPGRIVLAADNPLIKELLNQRDENIGKQCLYAIALMIYLHDRDMQPGQQNIPFEPQSFGLRAWAMTRQQKLSEQTA